MTFAPLALPCEASFTVYGAQIFLSLVSGHVREVSAGFLRSLRLLHLR